MTRAATLEYVGKKQAGTHKLTPGQAANFIRSKFPSYRIASNGTLLSAKGGLEIPPLKENVAKENADLLDRRQRLSVRELTMKFEKGLNTATWLSNEVKWRQVVLLDQDALLKNLTNLLESLKARVGGKNKDDVLESLSMVETLAVQLSQREAELDKQKEEVTRLATALKLASEDAKQIVEEERDNARNEIEIARSSIQRVQAALNEQEKLSQVTKQQDVEELKKEAQEARRVKMLHHRSKVMDMENEIQVLRAQLVEKSLDAIHLLKELDAHKRSKESMVMLYDLEGLESLGSVLQIVPRNNTLADFSKCSIQWYRLQSKEGDREIISGAIRPAYAPEPHDVGRFVLAEVVIDGKCAGATTAGQIDPAAGLGNYVEALIRKPETEFKVIVLQINGDECRGDSIHLLNIGKLRMRLSCGNAVVAREFYSSSMQLCGARGTGDAAPSAIFWRANKDLQLVLAFESARERNAAIMLARRFAIDCNVILAGPGDKTAW